MNSDDATDNGPAFELVRRPERERCAQAAQPGLMQWGRDTDGDTRAICKQRITCAELEPIHRPRDVPSGTKESWLTIQRIFDIPIRRGSLIWDLCQPQTCAVGY